jgi:hypothetical protein
LKTLCISMAKSKFWLSKFLFPSNECYVEEIEIKTNEISYYLPFWRVISLWWIFFGRGGKL